MDFLDSIADEEAVRKLEVSVRRSFYFTVVGK